VFSDTKYKVETKIIVIVDLLVNGEDIKKIKKKNVHCYELIIIVILRGTTSHMHV